MIRSPTGTCFSCISETNSMAFTTFRNGLWLSWNGNPSTLSMANPGNTIVPIILILSGQISPSPGSCWQFSSPVFSCISCGKSVRSNQRDSQCKVNNGPCLICQHVQQHYDNICNNDKMWFSEVCNSIALAIQRLGDRTKPSVISGLDNN